MRKEREQMNCENCKHWTDDTLAGNPPKGWRECLMGRVEAESGKREEKRHPRSLMRTAPAGETTDTVLFTAPTFGCIHWDAR